MRIIYVTDDGEQVAQFSEALSAEQVEAGWRERFPAAWEARRKRLERRLRDLESQAEETRDMLHITEQTEPVNGPTGGR